MPQHYRYYEYRRFGIMALYIFFRRRTPHVRFFGYTYTMMP